MERDEAPSDLDRLRSFVQGEIPGVSTVSATVSCRISVFGDALLDLSVGLRRTGTGAREGPDTEIVTLNLLFRVQDAILEAFEMLVACPTLTDFSLSFHCEEGQRLPRSLIGVPKLPVKLLVLHLFAVLRTSRSLTTLDTSFAATATFRYVDDEGMMRWYDVSLDTFCWSFFYVDLPILLRDNPLFEKLTFYLGWRTASPQAGVAYCFTRNPNLNSCALTILRNSEKVEHNCNPVASVVRLFMPAVQGEPLHGEALRELVIKTNFLDRRCGVCQWTITNMVERNSTLVRLEVDEYLVHHKDKYSDMARALARNQSLQDLGFRCTIADFQQLVHVFVPDTFGYHANPSLSTLKLSLPKETEVLECMFVLGQLVGSNTTLKHVELSLDLLNSRRREKDRQWGIRVKLEQMLNKELSRNICLQSLCVGSWGLFREGAGDEWEMRFVGPCLEVREYIVKVMM